MGEVVDTIPSILNKCLFVSPDRQTDGRTQGENNVSQPWQGGGGHDKPLGVHAFGNDFSFIC